MWRPALYPAAVVTPDTEYDVVVLGGGPAGATFAAIARKYAPGARICVLEKARFPRWHVGESTIPVANAVFEDLELLDALEASTFVKKMGITFVWGRDRRPWDADFLVLSKARAGDASTDVIDVAGQDFGGLIDGIHRKETPFQAFNVRRAEFDAMLLDRAREWGAEVREGTRATAVRRVDDRMHVEWSDDAGAEGTLRCDFVLDASGLSSILTRGRRVRDPQMNNFAVYGYLSGAEWKVTFNGTRERTTVFICSIPHGWIWYFPVDDDLMSVGVVTHTAHFEDRLRDVDLEAFFWESLRAAPELAGITADARLRDDVLPKGRRVDACADWSSWVERPIGPGWAAAGDAALFIDPVLSSGLTLALMSGHRAAYTWLTARARPALGADTLWAAYADYLRGEAGAFLRLARYFYGNNRAAESWWWEAQRTLNADGRLDLDPKQTFTLATAGFFPVPRAISFPIIAPLLEGLSGSDADLKNVVREGGAGGDISNHRIEHLATIRLALRAEPAMPGHAPPGQLMVHHDLVTDDPELAHRIGAAAHRIPPALGPVVEALNHAPDVPSLLRRAPALLPRAAPPARREAVLTVVRVAALKGFIRLHPLPGASPCPSPSTSP